MLTPEVQEILFELGVGDKIIANTKFCDYPKEAKKLPKVGDFRTPDIEKILGLNPDIVFVTELVQKNVIDTFKKLNLRYSVIYSRSVEEMFENITKIGKIMKKEQEALKIIERLKNELKKIRYSGIRPKVFPILWDNPVYTAGAETIIDDVITKAGGINPAKKYKKGYFIVNEEFIVTSKIDFLLLCDRTINKNSTFIKMLKQNNPSLKVITEINPDIILRASPRIIEGIKELNKILYERAL